MGYEVTGGLSASAVPRSFLQPWLGCSEVPSNRVQVVRKMRCSTLCSCKVGARRRCSTPCKVGTRRRCSTFCLAKSEPATTLRYDSNRHHYSKGQCSTLCCCEVGNCPLWGLAAAVVPCGSLQPRIRLSR